MKSESSGEIELWAMLKGNLAFIVSQSPHPASRLALCLFAFLGKWKSEKSAE